MGVDGAMVADGWQMYPWAQSESLTQSEGVVANAGAARLTEPIITKARRGLLSDMGGPFERETWGGDAGRRRLAVPTSCGVFQQNSCHPQRAQSGAQFRESGVRRPSRRWGRQSNF